MHEQKDRTILGDEVPEGARVLVDAMKGELELEQDKHRAKAEEELADSEVKSLSH